MTNFEDDNSARVKCFVNLMHGKDSVANVVDPCKCSYILIIMWSVVYNALKPLREKGND
jgi:hypothetical protein